MIVVVIMGHNSSFLSVLYAVASPRLVVLGRYSFPEKNERIDSFHTAIFPPTVCNHPRNHRPAQRAGKDGNDKGWNGGDTFRRSQSICRGWPVVISSGSSSAPRMPLESGPAIEQPWGRLRLLKKNRGNQRGCTSPTPFPE